MQSSGFRSVQEYANGLVLACDFPPISSGRIRLDILKVMTPEEAPLPTTAVRTTAQPRKLRQIHRKSCRIGSRSLLQGSKTLFQCLLVGSRHVGHFVAIRFIQALDLLDMWQIRMVGEVLCMTWGWKLVKVVAS